MVKMQGKIWLIGGTSDSATIAKLLTAENIELVITVATPTASSLYLSEREYRVEVGCLDRQQMQSFCFEQKVIAVVDASHPYAVEVSQQAIAVTNKLNIPYLRYERSSYQRASEDGLDTVVELDSFNTLLAGNYLQNQRVLLTVGCKVLPLFKSWQDRGTLFARVLPKTASLQTAFDAGFTSDRLIAIRPPISVDLEKALWQQWNVSMVVTKASGKAGGEDIKRQVAAELNIPLIIITRPVVTYPQQTSSLSEVSRWVKLIRR